MRLRLPAKQVIVCTLVALPFAVVILIQLSFYVWRPLFADQWGRGEAWLFWGWTGMPGIVFDEEGTGVKIDRQLNLIVVFHHIYSSNRAADRRRFQAALSKSLESHMYSATFTSDDGIKYHIPRTQNSVLVFDREGQSRVLPLAVGKAIDCYNTVTSEDLSKISINDVLESKGITLKK